MPKFIDVHEMAGATFDDVKAAHEKDLELQDAHDVRFLRFWVDETKGKVFCLSEAPDAEAPLAVHEEAGHPTDEIYQVEEGE